MPEPVRFVRELRMPGGDQQSGTAACLVFAGGRHYRLHTLVCQEYPDIRQSMVFRSGAQGWPLEWSKFIVLGGMDRDEAIAELGRRVEAKRQQMQGVAA